MTFLKINKLFNTKNIILILVMILGFLLLSDVSFAEGGTSSATHGVENQKQNETFKLFIDLINMLQRIGAALLGAITAFISLFLHPSWVNGEIFGLNAQLKTIWILISNVVYFLFAIVLIWIAFQNIIGAGTGKYELKQALPKFIIGVLMVPFSWFFVQFILSISAILTVAVLSLPADTFKENVFKNNIGDDKKICVNYVINMGKNPEKTSSSSETSGADLGFIKCKDEGASMKSIKDILNGKNDSTGYTPGVKDSIFGIISIYTYGVMNIEALPKITGEDLKDIGTAGDLTLKVLFDFIFFFAYLLLMIALFMALFVRGVRLWIYAMFSPVFGLMYFFDHKGVDTGNGKFSVSEFISLAMVPVLVSAALSFGLIFLFVVSSGIVTNTQNSTSTDGAMLHKCGNNAECMEFGGFSLQVNGTSGGTDEKSKKKISGAIFAQGVGNFFGHIIMALFGISILWISVKVALESSSVTKSVVKPIMDFGSAVGSLVMSAPKYAPIIPTGGSKLGSINSVANMGSGAISSINSGLQNEGRSEGNRWGSAFVGGQDNSQLIDTMKKQSVNARKDAQSIRDALTQFVGKLDDKALEDTNVRTGFSEYLKKIDAPKEIYEGLEKGDIDSKDKLSRAFDKNKSEKWGNGSLKADDVKEIIKLIGVGGSGSTTINQNITIGKEDGLKNSSGGDVQLEKGANTLKYKEFIYTGTDKKDVNYIKDQFKKGIGELKKDFNADGITSEENKKKFVKGVLKEIGITDDTQINDIVNSVIEELKK